MSIVTSMVLCVALSETYLTNNISLINDWLEALGAGNFQRVDESFGGAKYSQMVVYGLATSRFINEDFISFLRSLPWNAPENMVFVLKPEEGRTQVFGPLFGWDWQE